MRLFRKKNNYGGVWHMGGKLFEKDNVPKDRRTIEELVDRRCLLERVDLTYADLKGADLKGADLKGAHFLDQQDSTHTNSFSCHFST